VPDRAGKHRPPRGGLTGGQGVRTSRNQGGWSVFSLALLALVLGFFVVLGLRLYPGYYEAFNVRDALNSLEENPEIGRMSKVSIWTSLEKHFDISGLYSPSVKRENLSVDFDRKSGLKVIRLDYEYRTHIMFNIYAVLEFHPQIEVEAL
jgi:hypothetical protein